MAMPPLFVCIDIKMKLLSKPTDTLVHQIILLGKIGIIVFARLIYTSQQAF